MGAGSTMQRFRLFVSVCFDLCQALDNMINRTFNVRVSGACVSSFVQVGSDVWCVSPAWFATTFFKYPGRKRFLVYCEYLYVDLVSLTSNLHCRSRDSPNCEWFSRLRETVSGSFSGERIAKVTDTTSACKLIVLKSTWSARSVALFKASDLFFNFHKKS